MKVHHLNCGTMHPPRSPHCVCHVLLVETDNGLVLVDAGFGIDDCADPAGRVGPVRFITRPVFVPTETAAHQIEQLGFRREDVRHIVVTHFDTDHVGGIESWRGFAAAKELDEISSGIVLVSLPGHTRGHACVAVDASHRWVLHCGDAFYHYGTLDGTHVPRSLWAMETAVAFDRKKMQDNHSRLAELYRRAEPDLFIVSAHDSALFERAKATAQLPG